MGMSRASSWSQSSGIGSGRLPPNLACQRSSRLRPSSLQSLPTERSPRPYASLWRGISTIGALAIRLERLRKRKRKPQALL